MLEYMRPPTRSNRTANYSKASPLNALVKAVAKKKGGKGLTTTQKTQVKRLVSSPAELKYRGKFPIYNSSGGVKDLGTWTAFSSGITGVAEIMYALPPVLTGTDNWQRIGNKIKPKRLTCTLDIAATIHDTSRAVDKTVHIFLMTSKAVRDLDNYSAIPITTMLEDGQGGNTSFDGTAIGSMYPVDKNNFTVLHHKTFRLVKGFGLPTDSTVNTSAATTDSVISPSTSYRRIKMNVKTPKTLLYDTHAKSYPSNFAPFFVIGYTNNNPVDTASNGVDLMVLGWNELYYKDE